MTFTIRTGRTKRREAIQAEIKTLRGLMLLGLFDVEAALEKHFAAEAVRGREEPILDFVARCAGVSGEALRVFVDAVADGEKPEQFGGFRVEGPREMFSRAVAGLAICLDRERELVA